MPKWPSSRGFTCSAAAARAAAGCRAGRSDRRRGSSRRASTRRARREVGRSVSVVIRPQLSLPALQRPVARARATRTRASTATQPSGSGEHRVQVELGDLGQVLGEPGEPMEEVGERRRVGGGAPRKPRTSRPALPPWTSSSASTSVSGAIRKPASPISSASTPPGPNATSGPKTGSWTTPASSSTPPCDHRLHDDGRADPRRPPRATSSSSRGRARRRRSRSCARRRPPS